MIQIDNLEFRYPASPFLLRIPRLQIQGGAKVAFVGPSGSGKTTLLHLLAGVYLPAEGRIAVGDVVVSDLDDARRRDFRIARVGFVFQDFELLDYLDVRENILLPYFINRSLAAAADLRARAKSLAESMGLGDKLRRRIHKLSQGERQRVAVCRALLTNPQVLLADEPTGNLDPENKQRILHLLIDQANHTNATLIVVTHDHSLLAAFDQVIHFEDFYDARG